MTTGTYQAEAGPLLQCVASPEQAQDRDEEAVNENVQVGQELREQVAKALGCDPKDLAPRR